MTHYIREKFLEGDGSDPIVVVWEQAKPEDLEKHLMAMKTAFEENPSGVMVLDSMPCEHCAPPPDNVPRNATSDVFLSDGHPPKKKPKRGYDHSKFSKIKKGRKR